MIFMTQNSPPSDQIPAVKKCSVQLDKILFQYRGNGQRQNGQKQNNRSNRNKNRSKN